MAKQLNVDLSFRADTSQAKQALNELNTALRKIQTMPTSLFDDTDLKKASQAAMELQGHLQKAVNVDTGKLDLSRLSQSMQASQRDLNHYYQTLTKIGPAGQQAFLALSKSIATADTATLKMSSRMNEFATTLKNTARWQISSSILHGFMGTLQSAYGYAQDLNESLNNIRIVTGKSISEMDAFADRANRAAKALSTTTTAYTDAALIFYQQGLKDDEVTARTDVTIKMAHAAGESAEEVSSYMTAIWNNFDDGSKSLEYYGDVMADLGAKTAASSAEIAAGLEKFASIGETVGLSYEYATAAVATIVDKTRQSADTVGTALKTIFARLQGLQLGETLEDGVDLNKYSKALETVGVSVLDLNGNLRSADSIIADLGERWDDLSTAQQTALAQTVAGTRQYTQLMALMNNFDSFEDNVASAKASEGTLQEQADIYAESWEAARDRVSAAAQEIYNDLLDDEFFIKMLNGFEGLLSGIGDVINGVGGLKGVLLIVGSIFMKQYAKEIPRALENLVANFGVVTGSAQKAAQQLQQDNQNMLKGMQDAAMLNGGYNSFAMEGQVESLAIVNQMTAELADKQHLLSQAEIEEYQARIQNVAAIGEQLAQEGALLDKAQKVTEEKKKQLAATARKTDDEGKADNSNKGRRAANNEAKKHLNELQSVYKEYSKIQAAGEAIGKQNTIWQKSTKSAKELSASMREYAENLKKANVGIKNDSFEKLKADLDAAGDNVDLVKQAWANFELTVVSGDLEEALITYDTNLDQIREVLAGLGISGSELDKLEAEFEQGALSADEFRQKLLALKNGTQEPIQHTMKLSESLGNFASTAMNVASLISGIKNMFSIWNNDDLTVGEKIIQTLSSVGMVIMSLTGIFNKNTLAHAANLAATIASALGLGTEATAAGIAAGATATFGEVLYTVLWPIGLVMIAIALLVGTIMLLVNAFNQPTAAEKNLAEATEAAKNAKKAFDDTTTAAQELNDALDQYDSVYDTFKSCTVGTEEWKDAMQALNAEVNNLLDKYPKLKQYLEVDKTTGALTISEEGMETMRSEADMRVNAAMLNSAMADAKVAEARVGTNKEQFETSLTNTGLHWDSYAYNAIADAVSAGMVKGTETSGAEDMANIMAEMERNFREEAEQQAAWSGYEKGTAEYDQIVNDTLYYTGFFDEAGNAWAEGSQEWIDSWGYQQELMTAALSDDEVAAAVQNYVSSLEEAGTEADVAIATLTASLLSDRTDLDDAEKRLAAKYVEDDVERRKQELIDAEYANHDKGTETDALAEKTWERYLEASGNDWELQKNAIQGNDNNREYGYLDENGDKQTISFDEMASTIAAYEALEAVGVAGDNAAKALSALDSLPKDLGDGLRDYLVSGNLNSLSEDTLKDMQGSLEIDENGDASRESVDAYLMDAFGVGSTEELAAILGESYYEDFNEAQKIYADALADFSSSIPEGVSEAFNSLETDGLSLNGKQAILDMLENAMIQGGHESRDAVAEMLKDVPQENLEEFSEALGGINWETATIEDVRAALDRAGLSADDLGIDLYALMEAMQNTDKVTLQSVQEKYKTLNDIASGLKSGDKIEAEDYLTLSDELGADMMDGFFSVMADGTYQLTGDAEAFYALVKSSQQEKLLNNISQGTQLSSSLQKTDAGRMNSGAIGTTETADAAIAYLSTLELTEEELINLRAAQEEYNKTGQYTAESYALLNGLMADHNITEEQMTALIEQNTAEVQANAEALLSSATSLEELQQLAFQVAEATGGTIPGYGEALINLGSQYDNCVGEIEEYQAALISGNIEQINAAEGALELAIAIGEAAEKFGLDAEETENYAKRLAKNLGIDEKAAAKLAVANQRLDRGLLSLNENLEDYQKALKENSKNSAAWSKAMDAIKTDLADIFNLADGNMLSDEFAEATINSEDFKKALDGDVEALQRLQTLAADDIIASIKANIEGEENIQAFQNQWDYLKANMAEAIKAGNVDQTDLINSFNDMIAKGNMTKEQIEAALAGLHVSANVKTTYVSQKQQVPLTVTETAWMPNGTMTVPVPDGAGGTKNETYTSMKRITRTYDAGVSEADVVVPQYEIEGTEGAPGITTAFTAAPAPSISRGSTTSGGAGGGGGGGGGGNSEQKFNEEKTKDPTEEKDRYRVIKNKIEDLTAVYENLSGAKDKAFGSAKLAAINREIDAQRKLTAANKTYLNQIESYLASDASELQGKAQSLGLTATFDGNGTLTNYDSLVQAAVDRYNAAVEEFNKHTTDDEGAKAAFEAAQEEYDAFMEILDQYDETHDLWLEQMQTVLDDIMNEQALQLERTQYEVELKINVSEDALQYLEYMMDNIENKAYDCAEAFSYLNAMTGQYLDQQAAYTQGIYDIMGNKGISPEEVDALIQGDQNVYDKLMGMLSSGGEADLSDGLSQEEIDAAYGFTADDVDALREYVSGLIEANQNLQQVRQTVHEQILTVWDEWNEKMDDGIAKLEHLQAISDSYKNIIDIVGQRNLGVSDAFMNKLEQQATTQAKDKVTATKAKRDALQASYDNAKKQYEEQLAKGILSPEEIKQWEDSLAQMEADVQSASEEFQSAWEDALTAAQEQFEASVDRIIAAYDDAAAGLMGSISELQEAFDMKSDLSSQYLADYEKIYQINKLNREIENSVDATNNVKAKQELLELQSKINAYEEAGVEISEYQMEQLRQEYELKKAQIALEEAQSAKSEVQMTRDAEGNYSYVYTANSEDVGKAEQSYEDKLYAMQRSNAEYINDLQSNMIQLEQDYQDKVQEIMTDTSLTAEERMVKLNELNEFYDQKMKFYMSEAKLWEENSQRLYEEDWMNYASATGYKISSEEEWLDHWDETQLALLTGFTTLEEYYNNHNSNVSTLLVSASEAFATWEANIEEIMEEAGTSIGGFEEDATESLNNVASESEKTKDSVVDMADTAVTKMGEVVTAVVNWENQYSKSVQNILAQNNALITSFNQVIAGWSAYTSATGSDGSDTGGGDTGGGDTGGTTGGGTGGSDTGSTGSTDNSDKVAGVAGAIWFYSNSGWGTGSTRQSRLKEKGVTGAQAYLNAHANNGDIYREWSGKESQLKKYFYGSFDTGGYTGEWGDDSGRFAMLHQKEIVLNKDDTENFLKTVEMVRQISEMIDLNAMSSAGGLNSLFAATSSNLAQTLQQEVTIHAEFPNATDKDQITEAFSDLINLASQYASRQQ